MVRRLGCLVRGRHRYVKVYCPEGGRLRLACLRCYSGKED